MFLFELLFTSTSLIVFRVYALTSGLCDVHLSKPYDLTRHEDTIYNNRKQNFRFMTCRSSSHHASVID